MPEFYAFVPFVMQIVGWFVFRPLFRVFLDLRVLGLENLNDLNGPVIFAANHPSELDPTFLPTVFPLFSRFMPVAYVAHPHRHYHGFRWLSFLYGGFFFRLLGGWPVYHGLRDYEKSLKHHIKFLFKGTSLFVFPEGHVSPAGAPGDGRGGVAYLAWRTKTPVVPIALKGLCQITVGRFLARRHKVEVIFGRPIFPRELFGNPHVPVVDETSNDFRAAAQVIMSRIRELLVQ